MDHSKPFASPEEALEHYGVKGMRKGHGKPNRIDRKNGRDPKRLAILYGRRAKKEPFAVQNKMADHINQRVDTVNAKYKDEDFSTIDWGDPASWTPRAKEYQAEVGALTQEGHKVAIKETYGVEPKGKRHTELNETGDQIVIRDEKIEHADDPNVIAIFKLERDAWGLIVKVEPFEEEDALVPVNHGQDLKPFETPGEALEYYGIGSSK